MYYANCKWYVDMGEYNKPLCERKSFRPAKCSECPVYIRSIEVENAKLRELLKELYPFVGNACPDDCKHREECEGEGNRGTDGFPLVCVAYNRYFEELRELGIEVKL